MDNLGIYIHIPYCKRKCAYCNFISCENFETMPSYLEILKSEIRERSQLLSREAWERSELLSREAGERSQFPRRERVDSIFVGGGTPSVFLRGGILGIAGALRDCFDVVRDCEFTVEANPESVSSEFLAECREAGVNRISLGLQSCDDGILAKAGRLHTFADFCGALKMVRAHGFSNVSADLIIGLEGETRESFCRSLDSVLALRLEHVSVYALKCEEGTPLFARGYEVSDDFVADLYQIAVEKLQKAGLCRYEVSNFARSGYQCRHNIKYWTLAPYLGFGVAAHSFCAKKRRANTSDLQKYLSNQIQESELDVSKDEQEEFLMLGLRQEQGISLKEYQNRFGTSLTTQKPHQVKTLCAKGYIIIENNHLKINPKHLYTMNQILTELI